MSTEPAPNDAARRAIRVLGGPSQAARVLNVKGHRHQTVQSWLRHRVPADYCPEIEFQTRALGAVVPCEELRPDVRWAALRVPVAGAGEGVAHEATVVVDAENRAAVQTAGETI